MWRIQESHPVSSLGLHPSGGFVLVGTSHPVLRLYDLNTMSVFASQNASEQHEVVFLLHHGFTLRIEPHAICTP